MEDIFTKTYKTLNKAQKEAVDTIEGPVMVVAGPGTGKTTVLTLRIANILKQTDTPPHGILAITYTDAGVKAMRSKLRALIGSRAHEVEMHTFHSFARSMIDEYQDHFLEISGMKQMTDVEAEMLVKSIIEDPKFKDLRPNGKPDAYLGGILSSIDKVKRDALTPKSIREFALKEVEHIKNDEDSISTRGKTKGKLKADAEERILKCKKTILFADIYELYEEKKRSAKKMDFSDLIIELLVTLKNDELFLRLLQERFLHILVDEHQDTNDSQNLIIAMLAEFFETPNIFIVGDEKQAIYRFQGASVENFLLLRKRWPEMKLISLSTNYRSHQSILDVSHSLIENNYENSDESSDLRIKLISESGETPKLIDIVTAEDVRTMDDYLVKELKSLLQSEQKASIAIITKRNRDLERIIKLLEFNFIPVSSERSVDIFHHPIGAIFFNLIEFVHDPSKFEMLARTLPTGMWSLDFDESISLVRSLRAGKLEDLKPILSKLDEIRESAHQQGSIEFIIKLADTSGFTELISRDPSYVHVWHGIISLAESLCRDSKLEDPMELLKNLLAYKESAERRAVKVSVGAPDLAIRALTAHGSKGLEFDYVFLPYATEEAWVGRNHGSSFVLPIKGTTEGDIRDTRRLFYVALTRARKHVTILTPLEEAGGRGLTPLRFISEIDTKVSSINLPRMERGMTLAKGSESSVYSKYDLKIINLAKELLIKSGISVTALNHFLTCPNKFIYESVLKMPQAPSVMATKGTAMHEAIASIWANPDRRKMSVGEMETALVQKATNLILETFLSVRDKDLVKAEIEEEAPTVAKELHGHFMQSGIVYTEKWVESMQLVEVSGESLYIPIHGKLDTVIDSGESVDIFDYKTRQGMSVNEIKGETKSSDGNYFRQLVFYKLLTQAEPRWKTRRISTSLVFIKPDKKERCSIITLPVSEKDVSKVVGEIKALVDSVWSGAVLKQSCGEEDCEYCSQRTLLKH